jgi:hypothetical protein
VLGVVGSIVVVVKVSIDEDISFADYSYNEIFKASGKVLKGCVMRSFAEIADFTFGIRIEPCLT